MFYGIDLGATAMPEWGGAYTIPAYPLGAYMRFDTSWIAVQLELLYSRTEFTERFNDSYIGQDPYGNATTDTYDGQSAHYFDRIEVPLAFRFQVPLKTVKPYVFFGPEVTFIHSNVHFNFTHTYTNSAWPPENPTYVEIIGEDLAFRFGAVIGVGLNIPFGKRWEIQVDGRYTYPDILQDAGRNRIGIQCGLGFHL